MRHLAPFALLALLAAPAAAQEALTAEEFEDFVTGKTLGYALGSEPYGVERYTEGRRVLWAFVGDECVEGEWYPKGEDICFYYPDYEDEQCWRFSFAADGGLQARFSGPGSSDVLYSLSEVPLICPGYGV
ncbi:hypothetical protein [Pseudoroseicyclus tamaricis]|uniref:Uncharacterized protein n=1 Tax=Pseudoroseicyclus tamaricis TaxID=2705421 RepID=A0A6B2K590_9RHOB|nr:hypothetical protein [Pseudoroseicyclus tamaricis]NDV01916.1 hypothetical protein [Pseudoroseicyclus tamaricis]